MKIGLLIVATGKYISFVEQFRDSVERYFFRKSPAKVSIFVFTDSLTVPARTIRLFKEHKKFPYPTLTRYHTFYKYRKKLSLMDYLFYCDVDMKFVAPVDKEILSNLTATLHPGFYNKNRDQFTYEKRRVSTAYISPKDGSHYFCGGFNGGSARDFLSMARTISRNIDKDLKKGIVAEWHDESHLNRYLINHHPKKILSPSYCYPEEVSLPFPPKLIALSKDHETMRFSGLELKYRWFAKLLLRPAWYLAGLKGRLRLIPYFLGGLRFQSMKDFPQLWLWIYYANKFQDTYHFNCQLSKIEPETIDLVAIAFNNPKVIETQIKFLRRNLLDKFYYTVADNSTFPKARQEIRKICRENRVGYISLPKNPFNRLEGLGNLSHGSALTWVYNQYICPRRPRYFGFLDHDIFPYKKTGLIKFFHQSPVFGVIQPRGQFWYLWAGFCFFDMQYVNSRPLNFLSTHYKRQRMDTGGGNWESLYSKIDIQKLPVFKHRYLNLTGGEIAQHDMVEYFGHWLHLFNASNWYKMDNAKFDLRQNKIKQLLRKYENE